MDAIPGGHWPDTLPGEDRPDTASGESRPNEIPAAAPGESRPNGIPAAAPDEAQPGATPAAAPDETRTNTAPDSGRIAARLREETAELLALLPAARQAAAGGPAGGEAVLDGMARAAYRVLRIAENMQACAVLASGAAKAAPICITALAAAYVNGAAGVCRAAVFRPEWPREPLWSPGCARLFGAALGNLLANAVQYGGERPAVSVRAQKSGAKLLLTVADNGAGYPEGSEAAAGLGLAVARQYAAAFGGQLLINNTPGQGACVTLCLPLCAPGGVNPHGAQAAECLPGGTFSKNAQETKRMPGGAFPENAQAAERLPGGAFPQGAWEAPSLPLMPPDYMADRFSSLYVQLAPVCDLPL